MEGIWGIRGSPFTEGRLFQGWKKDQTPFWTGGNVHLHANKTKKIKGRDELFHYLDDIPRAIKEVMKKSKLVAVTDMAYTIRAEKREKNKK